MVVGHTHTSLPPWMVNVRKCTHCQGHQKAMNSFEWSFWRKQINSLMALTKKLVIKFSTTYGKHAAQTTRNFLRNFRTRFGNSELSSARRITGFLPFGTRLTNTSARKAPKSVTSSKMNYVLLSHHRRRASLLPFGLNVRWTF